MWDSYLPIKGSARGRRGKRVRCKVSAQVKIPVHWLDFLRDSNNKVELFLFLTEITSKTSFREGKEVHITQDQSVVSLGDGAGMQDCTHEEADT